MRALSTALFLVLTLYLLSTPAAADNGTKETKSVTTAAAAISGAEGSPSGEAYGVVGTSNSPDGAGIGAANLSGGADLVLDGSSDGLTDALLYHHLLDRPSAAPQTFDFVNSGGGGMALMMNGIDVVTTATDRDTLGVLMCSANQMPLWNGGTWSCIDRPTPRDPGQHLALNGNTLDVVGGPASGLDADTLDGLEGEYYARNLQRVVTVSGFGGDFTTVQAALDSITDAAAENRYLVKVGPGVYVEQVTMKPYVDIEGSGQEVTTIRWGAGGTHDGAVSGADHAELRQLTVEKNGGGGFALAMVNEGSSPRVSNVTLRVSDGDFRIAVGNTFSGSPSFEHCRIEVTGGPALGVSNNGGSPRYVDVQVLVTGASNPYGFYNFNGSSPELVDVDIEVVDAEGDHAWGIFNDDSSPTIRGGSVFIAGLSSSDLNEVYGISSESLSEPLIVDTDVEAQQAEYVHGIHATDSSLTLRNVRVRAQSSSILSYGIDIHGGSGAWGSRMSDLTVSVDGNTSYGLYMNGCGLTPCEVFGSRVQVHGSYYSGGGAQGIYAQGNSRLIVADSWIDVPDHSQYCIAAITHQASMEISGSRLVGGFVEGGKAVRANASGDEITLSMSHLTGGVSAAAGTTVTCNGNTNDGNTPPTFYSNTCPPHGSP